MFKQEIKSVFLEIQGEKTKETNQTNKKNR